MPYFATTPSSATPSSPSNGWSVSMAAARELCPHVIGTNESGEEVVLAWQFAGGSLAVLPQWRCSATRQRARRPRPRRPLA